MLEKMVFKNDFPFMVFPLIIQNIPKKLCTWFYFLLGNFHGLYCYESKQSMYCKHNLSHVLLLVMTSQVCKFIEMGWIKQLQISRTKHDFSTKYKNF